MTKPVWEHSPVRTAWSGLRLLGCVCYGLTRLLIRLPLLTLLVWGDLLLRGSVTRGFDRIQDVTEDCLSCLHDHS